MSEFERPDDGREEEVRTENAPAEGQPPDAGLSLPPGAQQDPEEQLAAQVRILGDGGFGNDTGAPPPPPFAAPRFESFAPIPWSERPYPFWGWLDALMMGGMVLVAMFAAVLLVSIVALMTGAVPGAEPGQSLGAISIAQAAIAMQLLGFGIPLVGLGVLFRLRYQAPLLRSLHLTFAPRAFLYAPLGLVTALFVGLLGKVLQIQDLEMPMNEILKSDADLILIGIAAVTFGPLFEELIFRGFLQPLVSKLVGAVGGILTTAIVFALPHGSQYGWHWQHLLIIVVAGTVFGAIRWKTQSTTAAVAAHAVYNGFLVAVTMYQRMNGLI